MVFFNVMSLPRLLLPVVAFALISFHASAQETTLQGEPFGYVKISIPAGSNSVKKTTQLSIPLLDSVAIGGQAQGTVTGVGANTISNAVAGWTPGELSNITNRFLIQITSGDATGRMFLIATNANTADTVTIDAADTNTHGAINTLGIQAGDRYRIHPCDTLGSLFQTPALSGVVGGTSLQSADSIILISNTTALNFFYHTASNRWVQNRPGFPDATHTPLPPYAGLQYSRIGNTALPITVTGRVPTATNRVMPIRNSGTVYVSQYWPVATAISNLGFDKITGWAKSTNARSADRLLIATNAGAIPLTYFFHSSSNAWVENRPGFPLRGSVVVPVGSSITVQRASTNTGSALLQQPIPYSLQ
jgi:uncharacterized protein (TIGR02597 family)